MSHVSVTTVNYVWSSNDFKPAQKLTLVFPIIIEKSICAPASYRVTSRHGHGGGQERSSRSSIQFQMPPQFVWHEYVCVRRLSPSERSNEKFPKNPNDDDCESDAPLLPPGQNMTWEEWLAFCWVLPHACLYSDTSMRWLLCNGGGLMLLWYTIAKINVLILKCCFLAFGTNSIKSRKLTF